MNRLRPALFLAAVLVLAAGCAHRTPANILPHKQKLRAYVESGRYAQEIADIALQANKYLLKRVKQPLKGKTAIVLDIDETSLTNLPTILENDFGFVPKAWDAWVARAQARAILPVQTVYETAVRHGVAVIFITGRKEADRTATERNLRDVGYDTWEQLHFKPDDPTLSTGTYKKRLRAQLIKDGFVILANIGDQESDFVDGHAERDFQLPNPFYLTR
jgi:5'-nucleotidase (lipoprotein e(P4) family)